MEERDDILLPRPGRHISAWGRGHTCKDSEPHDGPCTCYCGITQPYEREAPDAVPQDRER